MNEMLQELLTLNRKTLDNTDSYLFVEELFEQYYIVTDISDIQLPEGYTREGNTIMDGKVSYKIISLNQYKNL